MLRLPVSADAAGARLDRFLAENGVFPLTRARAQALIRDGEVRVNDRPVPKPGATLRTGDIVSLEETVAAAPPDPGTAAPVGEDIPLHILHEDPDLLVLDKPPGLVVHPAVGNYTGTLVNALVHHLGGQLSGVGGPGRPGIVHRLDKDTSGCLVVAKNDETHRALSAQFAGRTTEKTYLALVRGVPKTPAGTIDAPIGRHPVDRKRMAVIVARTTSAWAAEERAVERRSRSAKTDYRLLQVLGAERWKLSAACESRRDSAPPANIPPYAPPYPPNLGPHVCLLECRLHTGRTHQIRVHLAHLGHPILGDIVYGGPIVGKLAARQMLHAWRLGFQHPRTGQTVSFRAPLPTDFRAFGIDEPA